MSYLHKYIVVSSCILSFTLYSCNNGESSEATKSATKKNDSESFSVAYKLIPNKGNPDYSPYSRAIQRLKDSYQITIDEKEDTIKSVKWIELDERNLSFLIRIPQVRSLFENSFVGLTKTQNEMSGKTGARMVEIYDSTANKIFGMDSK